MPYLVMTYLKTYLFQNLLCKYEQRFNFLLSLAKATLYKYFLFFALVTKQKYLKFHNITHFMQLCCVYGYMKKNDYLF